VLTTTTTQSVNFVDTQELCALSCVRGKDRASQIFGRNTQEIFLMLTHNSHSLIFLSCPPPQTFNPNGIADGTHRFFDGL
jgi:hypothetical protein